MLLERWRRLVRDLGPEPALRGSGHARWLSFAELDFVSDQRIVALAPGQDAESTPATVSGSSPAFVIDVLAAWKCGRVLCPLEPGQPAPAFPAPPAGVVHLKTTSGTTGTPRVIAFTAAQLAADCDQIVGTMGLRRAWPNLGVVSLAHSYGFSNLVLPLLLHGIPLALAPSPLPAELTTAALGLDHLTLPAVPALWRTWLDAGAIPSATRRAISAGAPLPPAVEREIHARTGLKVHNFLGASECGGIAYDRTEAPRDDDAPDGTAMDGVELSIGDDGCLVVHSPAAGAGYWPEPDPRLGAGRYRTTDLAELRPDGLRLRGRAADVINLAGRKVSPETIEAVLRDHPAVRECLVFGVPAPDDPRGEGVVACVNLAPGTDPSALRSWAQGRLPAWQLPRDWWIEPELQPGQRGKLSRPEWRRRYLALGRAAGRSAAG